MNLFALPNANMSFRHLKRITCSGNYSKRLLLASANKLLLNLEHIKVFNDEEELAKLVQRQRKLKSLEITGCNKSGTCNIIRALELRSSLISLQLYDNVIGDMEAKFLANALKLNTSLRTLNLRNNQLNETGILILAENMKFLTSLDLGKSKIGDEGATFLTPILVSSFTLRFLYLNDNMMEIQVQSRYLRL